MPDPVAAAPMPGDGLPKRRNVLARVAAGVGGALVLLVFALFTIGTVLAAPVGVLVAHLVSKRRRRVLTPGRSWMAAAIATALAVIALLVVYVTVISPTALHDFNQAAAADASKPAPPPDWIARLAPPASRQPNPVAQRIFHSTVFVDYLMLMALFVMACISGAVIGTVGWAGTEALRYAFGKPG